MQLVFHKESEIAAAIEAEVDAAEARLAGILEVSLRAAVELVRKAAVEQAIDLVRLVAVPSGVKY
ncbi:MAG: hypothetical protein M3481_09045 [Actinomycetota bacterium]|nr:hypothetical protein [Actinomycetota bacterium]